MPQQKSDDTIQIDLDLDELNITTADSKVTYAEIKGNVLKNHILKSRDSAVINSKIPPPYIHTKTDRYLGRQCNKII